MGKKKKHKYSAADLKDFFSDLQSPVLGGTAAVAGRRADPTVSQLGIVEIDLSNLDTQLGNSDSCLDRQCLALNPTDCENIMLSERMNSATLTVAHQLFEEMPLLIPEHCQTSGTYAQPISRQPSTSSCTLGTEDSFTEPDSLEATTHEATATNIEADIGHVQHEIPSRQPASQTPTNATKKSPWSGLFKDNMDSSKGLQLTAVEDQPSMVILEEQDIDDIEEAWGYSLVGYFVGTLPSSQAIHNLCKSWKIRYKFFVHESG